MVNECGHMVLTQKQWLHLFIFLFCSVDCNLKVWVVLCRSSRSSRLTGVELHKKIIWFECGWVGGWTLLSKKGSQGHVEGQAGELDGFACVWGWRAWGWVGGAPTIGEAGWRLLGGSVGESSRDQPLGSDCRPRWPGRKQVPLRSVLLPVRISSSASQTLKHRCRDEVFPGPGKRFGIWVDFHAPPVAGWLSSSGEAPGAGGNMALPARA